MTLTELLTVIALYEVLKLFEVEGFDYCAIKGCKPRDHTMCKYTSHKPDYDLVQSGLSDKQRMKILNLHNELRQKVANGKQDGQPSAADMMELSWNKEAEDIAQRWSEQCENAHDSCRIMMDGTSAGQNVIELFEDGFDKKDYVVSCFNSWYDEVKNVDPSTIGRFDSSHGKSGYIGHYTALVNSMSKQIGCGYVETYVRDDIGLHVFLVCNYVPSGNVKNTAIYKQGEPCSACPEGSVCSMSYPGLCMVDEEKYRDLHKRSWAIHLYPTFNPFFVSLIYILFLINS